MDERIYSPNAGYTLILANASFVIYRTPINEEEGEYSILRIF